MSIDEKQFRLSEEVIYRCEIAGDYRTLADALRLAYSYGAFTFEQPVQKSVIETALDNAAEILANFKGEKGRAKIEEWEACYAMLFTQMNELVQSTKPVRESSGECQRCKDLQARLDQIPSDY